MSVIEFEYSLIEMRKRVVKQYDLCDSRLKYIQSTISTENSSSHWISFDGIFDHKLFSSINCRYSLYLLK